MSSAPRPSVTAVTPALVGVSLAYFMVLLDTTVLAVAEPDLITSLGTDVLGAGWATTAYTIALAAGLVAGGALTDRVGVGRVLRTSAAAFGIVSVLCSVSPSISALIAARALLGLAAAGLLPASMAALSQLYLEPRERARAVGIWASISGLAMAVGPVVGAVLVELFGWGSVFLLNAPLALVTLVLCAPGRLASIPRPRRIDPVPHALLALTLLAVTLAVTESVHLELGVILPVLVLGSLCAYAFVAANRRSSAPLYPGSLARPAGPALALGWGAVTNFGLATVLFVIPLRSGVQGAALGLLFLPLTMVLALNPLATGRLIARWGPLIPVRMGLTAFSVGLAATSVCLWTGASSAILALALLICGLGISWCLPALVGFAIGEAAPEAVGSMSGLLNASRQSGATIGAAAAAALLANGTPWGAPAAVAGAALICAVGAASALGYRHRARDAAGGARP
jgi:DHA2 family methylenomycin A resistance protein-like MFS transporter